MSPLALVAGISKGGTAMTKSRFLQFVNSQPMDPEAWFHAPRQAEGPWHEATEALLAELPQGEGWKSIGDYVGAQYPRVLLPELLMSLAWGAAMGSSSPAPQRYEPQDIELHLDRERFENILFQKPPRGAIAFLWVLHDEDSFDLPNNREVVGTFVRRMMWRTASERVEGEGYAEPIGAAIGFIQGKKLAVYPFPTEWQAVVEAVRGRMKQMTASEKARKQLPEELGAFVELLGWEEVSRALNKLRP